MQNCGVVGYLHLVLNPPITDSVMKTIFLHVSIVVALSAANLQAQQRRGGSTPIVEREPLANSETEKRILETLDDIDKNQRKGSMSVPVLDGRLLRLLTETTGAKNVVEIGTSVGYSSIWICLGLEATGGHLTTYEISEERAAKAGRSVRIGIDATMDLEDVSKLIRPIIPGAADLRREDYLDK